MAVGTARDLGDQMGNQQRSEQTHHPPSSTEHGAAYQGASRGLVLFGAALLFLGFALPLRGGGSGGYESLLTGRLVSGFPVSVRVVLFSAIHPIGVIATILASTLRPRAKLLRDLIPGLIVGIGLAEGLYFLSLIGKGLTASVAAWVGLLGSVLIVLGGIRAVQASRHLI